MAEHARMWQVLSVVLTVVSHCHAGPSCQTMCPVVDENRCTCSVKPVIAGSETIGNFLSCAGLGNLNVVPSFQCNDSVILTEFAITSSTLASLQRAAFARVHAKSLWLTQLGITYMDEDAFSGLENVLEMISLGYNNIPFIAGNTLNRLRMLRSVVLERNKLTEIPPGLFRNLTNMANINLQWNNIRNVSADAFEGLDTLQTLDMSDNSIADLPPNFLRGAAQVRELRLPGNRLTSLTSEAFNSMPNLTTLDLSRNLLSYLPANMLPGCPKLTIIYLASNNISSISSLAIAALQGLENIDASNNIISFVPFDAFRNALSLKLVLFANNRIAQIDSGLFRNTPILSTLNLTRNLIRSIPSDVFPDQGSSIKIFDVSNNRLTDVSFLSRLTSLLSADFSNNLISTMNFSQTPGLSNLRASYNQIKRFGKESLARLPGLKELYLDNNLIDRLEAGFLENNPILQTLSLGNNLLTTVPVLNGSRLMILRLNDNNITSLSSFNCPMLSELYLQNNQLRTVPSDVLSELMNIRTLDLSNNFITSLPMNAFQTLRTLFVLRLAYNGFSVLSSENFYGLSNLAILDISGNKLQTLTYDSMSALQRSLGSLYLGFNPFLCSCDNLWLRGFKVIQDRNVSVCYVDEDCYLLMCNPARPCPTTVNPVYPDSDQFCSSWNASARFCPQPPTTTKRTTTTSTTTMSTSAMDLDTPDITTVISNGESTEIANSTASSSSPAVINTVAGVGLDTPTSPTTNLTQPIKSDDSSTTETYIYIIIAVVLGVAVLVVIAIVIFCILRRRKLRGQNDPLKQARGSNSNDEVGILRGESISELDDAPLPPDVGKQNLGLQLPDVSDDDLGSSFRPRPKGTVGLPYGNFRLPGSDGRRWRTGGQVDRDTPDFTDNPDDSGEANEGDGDPETKRRRNESQFVDGDQESNGNEEAELPSKFLNYLLWRGGQTGPYKTEKLQKNDDDKEADGSTGKQKKKSEFVDDDGDFPSPKLGGDLLWRKEGGKGPYNTTKLTKDQLNDGSGDEGQNGDDAGKKGRNASEFVDTVGRSLYSDDQQVPGPSGLLWRGGPKGPYNTQKLPKDFGNEETENSGIQNAGKGKHRSEFSGEEDFPSPNSDDYRLPSGIGADLLWRGGRKGPYTSEKLTLDDPNEEVSADSKKRNQDKRKTSEFTGDEEHFPSPNSDDYRLPSKTGDLLWRGTNKGPYNSAKLTNDGNPDEQPGSVQPKRTDSKYGTRRSEFTGDEENFPSPSADDYRLPSKAGGNILWRGPKKGPYLSEKFTLEDSGEIISKDPSGRTLPKQKRRSHSNASVFLDSASETYSGGNFRFPSKPGDDILWRAGQKRPYSTVKLPKDYCDSDLTEYNDSSQTQGRRSRAPRQASEFMDDGDNKSIHSAQGFRIPDNARGKGQGNLQWRHSRMADSATLSRLSGADLVSLDGRRNRMSVYEPDTRSNLSDSYGTTFGNFKTNPNKQSGNLYWKSDRFGNGFSATSDSDSEISGKANSRRSSGSDMGATSDDNRRADQPRRPHGTAKDVSAQRLNQRKTQMNNDAAGAGQKQPTVKTASSA